MCLHYIAILHIAYVFSASGEKCKVLRVKLLVNLLIINILYDYYLLSFYSCSA